MMTLPRLSSLVLVHGAGSGPWVFDGWERFFPDTVTRAIDLHAGVAVEHASMDDGVLGKAGHEQHPEFRPRFEQLVAENAAVHWT